MTAAIPTLSVLTTARLTLDALTPADAAALFTMQSDPEVTRYLSMEPMHDVSEAVTLIAALARRAEAGEELRWAIRRTVDVAAGGAGSGRMIGVISLSEPHNPRRRAEVGYGLARDVWRQGYAREAMGAVLDYAFGPLQLNRVEALVYEENEPSRALLRTLGFVEEAYLREHAWEKGRYWDDVILALLASDYMASRH